MILLIDDAKEGGWADIIARNARAGKIVLRDVGALITELHIDYDLGHYLESDSGLSVLQYAKENNCLPNKVFLVSWNPPGREAMKRFLLDNGYKYVIDSRYERE